MNIYKIFKILLLTIAFSALISGCLRVQTPQPPGGLPAEPSDPGSTPTPDLSAYRLPTREPGAPLINPSPDAERVLPPIRADFTQHIVQYGDTLNAIAFYFGVDVNALIEANQPIDPEMLEIGRLLQIPPPIPVQDAPGFKIIPDSELVYSPSALGFNIADFIRQRGGYLASYTEEVDTAVLTSAEVVERVSRENSVNPRLLLALLDYQSGWVSSLSPAGETLVYPLRYFHPAYKGLYLQLSQAANELNRGFYLWRINGLSHFVLADGSVIRASPQINAGTAGVQLAMSRLAGLDAWNRAVNGGGLDKTYSDLFGYPFDYSFEPLLPPDLKQPPMQLPFETEKVWSFTSGPHGGWGDGAAWAALDFAPPGNALGCVPSDEWVTAVSDGLITRAQDGVVIQDLDGDGYEQTGWTVIYMHVESRDRVAQGTEVKAGERIGHPSCEGGFSNGTHVHLARRYNGEWISADGSEPFNLDGWISSGTGVQYDGYLLKENLIVEAWDARLPENQIQR
jgi:murein DD-endopeptidase MepM/ murein hydrolase activator NlpD